MGDRKTGRPAICELCGGGFLSYRLGVRFCSKRCAGRSSRIGKTWRADANPRFNGGLSTWKGRAIVVFRNGSHMLYSRALMAGHIGRLLRRDEIVHHINEDPTDDRIENLEIVTRARHVEIHNPRKAAQQ